MELNLENRYKFGINTLSFDDIWEDGCVTMSLYNDYYVNTFTWNITKEQAQQIINHLKEQFEL